MKKTVCTILTLITSSVLIAQSSIDKEFDNFIKTKMQSDGSYKFNSLCGIDTMYTEDIETGELVQTLSKFNYSVTKNDPFDISTNGTVVTASFNSKIFNDFGEETGIRKYLIDFDSENQFEISGIKDEENSSYEKNGECWTKIK